MFEFNQKVADLILAGGIMTLVEYIQLYGTTNGWKHYYEARHKSDSGVDPLLGSKCVWCGEIETHQCHWQDDGSVFDINATLA